MKWWLKLVLAAIAVLAIWWILPFFASDENQVRRQHEKFFKLAGGRNWIEAKALMSSDYQDVWGNRAEDAIDGARQAFQGFIVLDLEMEISEVSLEAERAQVKCKVQVSGSGAGVSQQVVNEVKRLQEPWVFTWRREDAGPSGWKLIAVDQPELQGISMPQY